MPIRFLDAKNGRRHATWNAWRCAGWATLALTGCVVVNVAAGCGGGGGGGANNPGIPTPTSGVTFVLRNKDGVAVNGTVTLNGTTLNSTGGRAVFTGVRPGTYTVSFTVGGETTTSTIVVNQNVQSQAFALVPGVTQAGVGISVRGRILLNPNSGTSQSANLACNGSSLPVTAQVLLEVKALNLPGQPVVTSIVRRDQTRDPQSTQGTYNIVTIPFPGTYRIIVRPGTSTASGQAISPFAGQSASFTIRPGQTEENLDICVNQGLNPEGTPPAPPATGTPTAIATATGTATATAAPTVDPSATPTVNPSATPTVDPSATPTVGATVIPTPTPTVDSGDTPGPPALTGSRRRRS